jgi:hypothetical protein
MTIKGARIFAEQRLRLERGATSLRQGYGGPPKLQRRRQSPRESERGVGPREHW